jgi:hypothetical protein
MLAPLLAALEFRCNNSAYRPVMDAIDLLARYAGTDSDQKLYAASEKVPVDGVVPKAWLDGVVGDDGRVERIPYELCVLIALRRREVYVQGAGRWKDPDEDLPGDFEDNRDVHYSELGKPLDVTEFVSGLRGRLDEGLTRLNKALARDTSGGVRIITRKGSPWVSVPKLGKLPEPRNLAMLKAEVQRRWGGGRCWCCSRWARTWDPADGHHRLARRRRGRAAARPVHLRHPREPAGGDHHGGQRHPGGPRAAVVGRGDQHRVGLQAVRVLGPQCSI